MMRIVIIISVLLVLLYFIDLGYFYSPLGESEMNIIFKDKKSFHKICSKDFLGFNTHSELFEMYVYKVEGASINTYFPKISMWEGKVVGEGAQIAEWKNCPLHKDDKRLFGNVSKLGNFHNFSCFQNFDKELLDSQNYYSFINFSMGNQRFLLYCPKSQTLYYIRKKGV